MQTPISILNGIYASGESDFRTQYPLNLRPIAKESGISRGYLRPASGIIASGDIGPGISYAGINWRGAVYRVMGTSFVRIDEDGSVTTLGEVSGQGGNSTLDYSFDLMGVTSGGDFWLYDPDAPSFIRLSLEDVIIDHIWVDGYFMLTDGEFVLVTELNDPYTVSTLKYGSAEADPDPIQAILKLRNEPYVLNRYTTEVFNNIGGSGFPFQRIEGAQIQRGAVGTHACCVYLENIAFVGGGRNEPASVWVASGGSSVKIASREIDLILADYSEDTLSGIRVETAHERGHEYLYIHLPDQTLVYDATMSTIAGEAAWFRLSSSTTGSGVYRGRNPVWCYDKWWVGDASSGLHGYLTDEVSSHWGESVRWEFNTPIIYNESNGAIIHEIELLGLFGRGEQSQITTQYSLDGETWSMPKSISLGALGNRNGRAVWLSQGALRNWRIQKFHGTSGGHFSFARLMARIEPLAV